MNFMPSKEKDRKRESKNANYQCFMPDTLQENVFIFSMKLFRNKKNDSQLTLIFNLSLFTSIQPSAAFNQKKPTVARSLNQIYRE